MLVDFIRSSILFLQGLLESSLQEEEQALDLGLQYALVAYVNAVQSVDLPKDLPNIEI